MFAAVERYLSNISGRAGTLLVLDDLQWAGGDALDLLAHLIRSTHIRRLRILGAFRSTEAPAGLPLSTLMADLAREDLVGQFELGPLEPEDALALAGNCWAGKRARWRRVSSSRRRGALVSGELRPSGASVG